MRPPYQVTVTHPNQLLCVEHCTSLQVNFENISVFKGMVQHLFLAWEFRRFSPNARKAKFLDKISMQFAADPLNGDAALQDHGHIEICFFSHFFGVDPDKIKFLKNK